MHNPHGHTYWMWLTFEDILSLITFAEKTLWKILFICLVHFCWPCPFHFNSASLFCSHIKVQYHLKCFSLTLRSRCTYMKRLNTGTEQACNGSNIYFTEPYNANCTWNYILKVTLKQCTQRYNHKKPSHSETHFSPHFLPGLGWWFRNWATRLFIL